MRVDRRVEGGLFVLSEEIAARLQHPHAISVFDASTIVRDNITRLNRAFGIYAPNGAVNGGGRRQVVETAEDDGVAAAQARDGPWEQRGQRAGRAFGHALRRARMGYPAS